MLLGIVSLLYITARFGFEIGGPVGAITPLLAFGCVEALLVRATAPVRP
jgi:hypothetical protein